MYFRLFGGVMRLGALWHTRWRQRPKFYRIRLLLGESAAALWVGYVSRETRTARPSPPFIPLVSPPPYSVTEAGVFPSSARPMPLYSHPALPACRVGQ